MCSSDLFYEGEESGGNGQWDAADREVIEKAGLRMRLGVDAENVNPEDDPRFRQYWEHYHQLMKRNGVSPAVAKATVRRSNTVIGALMVALKDADALICGARSLELEARFGRYAGGPVYRIVDEALLDYRAKTLRRGKLINIIVSGSGNLRPADYRLFRSEHVDGWIATTAHGASRLQGAEGVRVLVCGGKQIDWLELVGQLSNLGIEHLPCEGGPALYGSMMRARLIDEKFLTIAPQEIGAEPPAQPPGAESRPPRFTSFTGPGFTPEDAQWFRLLSCRTAGDHLFLRYRVASHPDTPVTN